MLLDFQMPRFNGLQVIEQTRQFYIEMSEKHSIELKEPLFVFLTAYKTKGFEKHLEALNILHCYEKPLQPGNLNEIL